MKDTTIHSAFDYDDLRISLGHITNDSELYKAIVNAPFRNKLQTTFLFLGIIVLLLVDKETKIIHRIALSDTDFAKLTTDVSAVPFEEIKIKLHDPENIIAKTITSGEMHDTTDWRFLFTPALTPAQARMNQANSGIAYSAVHPLKSRDGGALIYSYFQYKDQLGDIQDQFMQAYTAVVDQVLGLKK